jgi:hypothetical protein
MSAVLLALFNRFSDAENVRTELVRDGFPTDRVELTASREKGRAGVQPAESSHGQFVQYFGTLFNQEDERGFVQELAKRVAGGNITTIAVHPRGDIETSRAIQILENQGALRLVAHDLQNQAFEHAASPETGSWLARLLPEHLGDAGRFYLRLLPDKKSATTGSQP